MLNLLAGVMRPAQPPEAAHDAAALVAPIGIPSAAGGGGAAAPPAAALTISNSAAGFSLQLSRFVGATAVVVVQTLLERELEPLGAGRGAIVWDFIARLHEDTLRETRAKNTLQLQYNVLDSRGDQLHAAVQATTATRAADEVAMLSKFLVLLNAKKAALTELQGQASGCIPLLVCVRA